MTTQNEKIINQIKKENTNIYGQLKDYIRWKTFVDKKGVLNICELKQTDIAKELGASRTQVKKQLGMLVKNGVLHLIIKGNKKSVIKRNIYIPIDFINIYNSQFNSNLN